MAKKRMINADLLDNDVFLDLPISAKLLYFYLILKADDDGMVAKPKSVVREVQASLDDLEKLKRARYVLSFPSGVICIKHWKMHNSIPKDRYKPTTYQEELATLIVRKDGSYTEKDRHKELTKIPIEEVEEPVQDKQEEPEKTENEEYEISDFDLDSAWKKIRDVYPRNAGKGSMARQYYNDFFLKFPKSQHKYIANLVVNAIRLYIRECKKDYNGEEKYYKAMDKWFKEDFEYYIDKAEEDLKKEKF